MTENNYDVLIIGGGPAGSTAGALLAEQGHNVLILEKENFPRFHTGESLLPASNAIWRRLGIYETLKSTFISKPGGRWYYGDLSVRSLFKECEDHACFKDDPNAFMVHREKFDKILLDNAKNKGATILSKAEVIDLIFKEDQLIGLKYRFKNTIHQVYGTWTLDCSGLRGVIASKLKIRKPNALKRLAIFAHYEAQALEPNLKEGWFVGGMIHDGWVWTIPISDDIISIGVVASSDYYKKEASHPEDFLNKQISTVPYFKMALKPNPKQVSKVSSHANIGYTSEKLTGKGWTLVGDAAFFIDPCYSSGVHFAADSAQQVADILLKSLDQKKSPSSIDFLGYQKSMRSYEKIITRMVETFYLATTNKVFRKFVPSTATDNVNKKVATLTGGDFKKNHMFIHTGYYIGKLCHLIWPDSKKSKHNSDL